MSATTVLIFSRMDSSRLPGKALMDLAGRPLLGQVIDRVRRIGSEHRVVVATSDRAVDDPLAAFVQQEITRLADATHGDSGGDSGAELALFRGDGPDTVLRSLQCAKALGFSRFIRICGDSPFACPVLIQGMIDQWQRAAPVDLLSNVHPRTWPAGCSLEMISIKALKRLAASSDHPEDREHLTRYFYRHPDQFTIHNMSAPDDRYAGIRLVVDTPEDLARTRQIMDRLNHDRVSAPLKRICSIATSLS